MSPGAKFKDLDLLGFPLRVVVGRKAAEGIVELSERRAGGKREVPANDVLALVRA
jgi:prolyl-tRNA synthetase